MKEGAGMKTRNELNYQLFLRKTGDIAREPYNVELDRYTDIYNGDVDGVRKRLLSEGGVIEENHFSQDEQRNLRYHVILEAYAIAKACMTSGMGHDEAYTLADIYIRKADICESIDTLLILFEELQLDFAERMGEIKKEQVVSLHVRRCIDYIYEHLKEDLTVKSLAQLCGINPSYLSRLFVEETGVNLKQFVLNAKIDTAQNLLRYTELSYLDISVALNFSSQSAFIYTFRKITGTTPKKYREEHYVTKE